MIDIPTIISLIYLGYILVTIGYLVVDNRDSQSTFAWIFVLLLLPIIGLMLYIVFGRGWLHRSRRKQRQDAFIKRSLEKTLYPLIRKQESEITHLTKEKDLSYKKELFNVLYNTSGSLLTTKNKVKVLQGGREKFRELFEDIKNAKKFIHMEYYIWRSDELGRQLKDLLIAKAKEGVTVRIMYDWVGSFTLGWQYRRELRKNGVKIKYYAGYNSSSRLHTLNHRNHTKIVVIDGVIGYNGGINIGQEYISGTSWARHWRDTHLRIEGEAVNMLQALFATHWYETTKENLFGPEYYHLNRQIKTPVPIQITGSGVDSEWNTIRHLFFMMITLAEKKVYIQTPYFIPDPSVYVALETAALRGVDVRIMTAGIPDRFLVHWAAYTYFKGLVKAGVKFYLYKKGFMHSKTVNVDNEICSVGTANIDVRSLHLNYEVNSLIYDKKTCMDLEKSFLNDLKDCTQFKSEDYQKLGVFRRFRNSIARLFAPLL